MEWLDLPIIENTYKKINAIIAVCNDQSIIGIAILLTLTIYLFVHKLKSKKKLKIKLPLKDRVCWDHIRHFERDENELEVKRSWAICDIEEIRRKYSLCKEIKYTSSEKTNSELSKDIESFENETYLQKRFGGVTEYFNECTYRKKAYLLLKIFEKTNLELREFSNDYREGCIKLFDSQEIPFSLDLHGYKMHTAEKVLRDFLIIMDKQKVPRFGIIFGKGEILSKMTRKILEVYYEEQIVSGELHLSYDVGHVELYFNKDETRWPTLNLNYH